MYVALVTYFSSLFSLRFLFNHSADVIFSILNVHLLLLLIVLPANNGRVVVVGVFVCWLAIFIRSFSPRPETRFAFYNVMTFFLQYLRKHQN